MEFEEVNAQYNPAQIGRHCIWCVFIYLYHVYMVYSATVSDMCCCTVSVVS